MPSYKNAKEAKKAMGASIDETKLEKKKKKVAKMSEEKQQRKADRIERRKYGNVLTSKKKKKQRALAARAKKRSEESLEQVKNKKINEAVGYTEGEGGSMSYKKKGASMKNKQERKDLLKYNPVVDKSKGMGGAGMYGNKDGMSMYGKKHGSSMNKYDKKMMHLREQISDDKKAIHRTDQAKKSHAHSILKHMRKF